MIKLDKDTLWFFEKTVKFMNTRSKSDELKICHRKSDKDFTRCRKLNFEIMIILMLQKWVKSLQLRLNEFFCKTWIKTTASAFTLARNKISHWVFISLNKSVLIDRFYDKQENKWLYKIWNGFRILATDWSKIILPDSKEIKKYFWEIKVNNGQLEQKSYSTATLSTIYDVLNNMAIDNLLEGWVYSERALAIKHIINLWNYTKTEENDLIIFDRGYHSYLLFWTVLSRKKDFVCRIWKNSYKEAMDLFDKESLINSKTVILEIPPRTINDINEYNEKYWLNLVLDNEFNKIDLDSNSDQTVLIQKTIKVRFVRVVLDDWEIEVLATSLLDEEKYPNEIFKELYFKRWWIEGYYDVLKNRLWLENFSWKTVESVKQDIFSTILLSNFESIATKTANEQLAQKSKEKGLKNEQKVNKQVSFNIIKNYVLELFLSDKPIKTIIREMEEIFLINPTQYRKWRTSKRKISSHNQIMNYHKRKKKHCF